LAKIEEQLVLLRGVQKVNKEKFIEDPREHVYASHLLQVAIQCAIDIGSHIVSGLNLGRVEEYKDIAELLHKEGVIPKILAEKLRKMIGLRNLLIHEYLTINLGRLYQIIQENIGDLEEFAKYIEEFIRKGGAA
jgi:uncharacterized protein YutE (UPF0331/DUF86 family)